MQRKKQEKLRLNVLNYFSNLKKTELNGLSLKKDGKDELRNLRKVLQRQSSREIHLKENMRSYNTKAAWDLFTVKETQVVG